MRTPHIPQVEESDCGAACLGIILAYHGCHVAPHELRETCGVGRDGTSAAALVRAAGLYGMAGRGHRVRLGDPAHPQLDALRTLPLPAVALVDPGHFVVLEGLTRHGRVAVNDPASGRHTLAGEQFAASFGGVVLTFVKTPEFATREGPEPLPNTLLRWLLPHLGAVAFVLLGGLASVGATLATAFAVRAALSDASGPTSAALHLGAIALLALGATWVQQRALSRLLIAVATRRSRAFMHTLLRLPGLFFQRRFIAALAARAQLNDAVAMELTNRLLPMGVQIFSVVGLLLVMLGMSQPLTAAAVLGAAVSAIVLRLAQRLAADREKQLAAEQARRDGVAMSGLSMIESLKAEGTTAGFFDDWAEAQARDVDTQHRLQMSTGRLLAVAGAAEAVTGLAVLLLGALRLATASMTIAEFMAFLTAFGVFMATAGTLSRAGLGLAGLRGQLLMLDDVLEAATDPRFDQDPAASPSGPKLRGLIELDGVTFGYDLHRPPLIHDVTVRIEPGSRVAIVGATGSGKSTLGRLITGALQPIGGEIRLDGEPLGEIPRCRLVRSLAYVTQHPLLIEDTLAGNITLGDPSIGARAVTRALEDTRLTGIARMRGGARRARVDQDGRNFSGGERQRIALARALARDPSILVLDEATSAMEGPLEAAIDANLRRRGITTVVIAHRLSTVRSADLILVVDGGAVVRSGRHDDLIASYGPYRRLVEETAA
ncbi:ATP-binding cassette domain-containing protein [Nonomuraea sp. NPDC000554]|uniref:ATP-binding cassette domain-containing protein n=1 Tax=Nonomuraea sp. NPDC000554 TaxID=3154259 RepID=UPI003317263E